MKLVSYFASFLRIAHGVDWQTQREQKRYIQVWLFFFSFSNCWAREWPFSRLFNAPMYQRIFAIDSTTIAAAPLCAANIYFANKGKHQKLAASHRLFCAFSTRRRYLCISKNDIEWTNIATEWKYSMANESYIFFFCSSFNWRRYHWLAWWFAVRIPAHSIELLFGVRLFSCDWKKYNKNSEVALVNERCIQFRCKW